MKRFISEWIVVEHQTSLSYHQFLPNVQGGKNPPRQIIWTNYYFDFCSALTTRQLPRTSIRDSGTDEEKERKKLGNINNKWIWRKKNIKKIERRILSVNQREQWNVTLPFLPSATEVRSVAMNKFNHWNIPSIAHGI